MTSTHLASGVELKQLAAGDRDKFYRLQENATN